MSSKEELHGPRDFLMADGGKLWLLADADSGFSGRVAVVDLESQSSTGCRDFMDGFVYHGLCAHPSNPQVAHLLSQACCLTACPVVVARGRISCCVCRFMNVGILTLGKKPRACELLAVSEIVLLVAAVVRSTAWRHMLPYSVRSRGAHKVHVDQQEVVMLWGVHIQCSRPNCSGA